MEETEDTTLDDTTITDENIPLTLLGEEHEDHLLSSDTKRSYKTRNRLAFAAFALTYLTMAASYSVIAPFYPNEAKEKGASVEVVGFIFGMFALVTFVVSPVVGVLIPIIGVRFFLFSGMFVFAVAQFLFGFLNRMPKGTMFITYSFILRAFAGAGGAAVMTAAIAFLAQCFPDNIATVMGGLELFTGIGLTLGPLIGGVLYEYGGFGMPFFVLAGLMLVTLPIAMCILPPIHQARSINEGKEGTTNAVTIMTVLKIPAFNIVGGATVVSTMATGVIEPTLAPHLKNHFNITSSNKIGLLFFMFCATYALFSPLFGWVADKTNPRWVMTFGCFFCAIGFFLLGPVPFSFMPNELWLVYCSLAIIGLSLGPLYVPTISEMENIVKARGYPDNIATHGIISGVYGSAFNFGAFIGPTLGGVFTEYLHFNWTCTGFGVILLIQTFLLLVLTLSGSSTKTTKMKETEASSQASQESISVPGSINLRMVQV